MLVVVAVSSERRRAPECRRLVDDRAPAAGPGPRAPQRPHARPLRVARGLHSLGCARVRRPARHVDLVRHAVRRAAAHGDARRAVDPRHLDRHGLPAPRDLSVRAAPRQTFGARPPRLPVGRVARAHGGAPRPAVAERRRRVAPRVRRAAQGRADAPRGARLERSCLALGRAARPDRPPRHARARRVPRRPAALPDPPPSVLDQRRRRRVHRQAQAPVPPSEEEGLRLDRRRALDEQTERPAPAQGSGIAGGCATESKRRRPAANPQRQHHHQRGVVVVVVVYGGRPRRPRDSIWRQAPGVRAPHGARRQQGARGPRQATPRGRRRVKPPRRCGVAASRGAAQSSREESSEESERVRRGRGGRSD
mmetsp:Transcript_3432/g.13272  ORF Transcript_3432/g.13272 Transcript_3432/m.13272 type:complete len:365 (+) Transcript_3432:405-1499(+)